MIKLPLLILPPALAALSTWLNHGWGIVPLLTGLLSFVVVGLAITWPSFGHGLFELPIAKLRRLLQNTIGMPPERLTYPSSLNYTTEKISTEGSILYYAITIANPPAAAACDFCAQPTTRVLTVFESSRATNTISFSGVPGDQCDACSERLEEPLILIPEPVATLVAGLAKRIRSELVT